MKKIICLIALTSIGFAGFSQDDKSDGKKLNFSIGVDAQLPMGDYKDIYGFGIGGSAAGAYNVDSKFAITLSAGYLTFSGKTVSTSYQLPTGVDANGNITYTTYTSEVKYPAFNLIPILAGIKYGFTDMIYGSAQLGMSMASGGGGANFTYAPGIGFKFSNFDVLVKYTGMSAKGGGSSFSTIGLRAAYNF